MENKQKYYLIFKDADHNVIFIESEQLNDLYKIILDKSLLEGSYRIFKGVKIIWEWNEQQDVYWL